MSTAGLPREIDQESPNSRGDRILPSCFTKSCIDSLHQSRIGFSLQMAPVVVRYSFVDFPSGIAFRRRGVKSDVFYTHARFIP